MKNIFELLLLLLLLYTAIYSVRPGGSDSMLAASRRRSFLGAGGLSRQQYGRE